jgi:hypothetical protein
MFATVFITSSLVNNKYQLKDRVSDKDAQTLEKDYPTLAVLLFIIIFILSVLYYIGTCTIFSRANPKVPFAAKLLVYILFLFFGDIYILYFVIRMGVNGIRGTTDYTSLPYPSSSRSSKMRITTSR